MKKLLDEYLTSYDYRYDPDTVLIEPDCFKKKLNSKKDLLDFLAQVRKKRNIVFYAPLKNQQLIDTLLEAGFFLQGQMHRLTINLKDQAFLQQVREKLQSLSKREIFTHYALLKCRASEHKGLGVLLKAYLEAHKHTFLDAFGSPQKIMEDLAEYHYFEGKSAKPLGFHKFIHSIEGREAEITFGQGSARQNVAMILFSILEEEKLGASELEVNVPYESVTKLLVHLGIRKDYPFAVLVTRKT